jgi:hypothetical protein
LRGNNVRKNSAKLNKSSNALSSKRNAKKPLKSIYDIWKISKFTRTASALMPTTLLLHKTEYPTNHFFFKCSLPHFTA